MAQGDEVAAEALFRAGMVDEQQVADPANRVMGLIVRAMATVEHGDPRLGHARFLEALEENARVGQVEGAGLCLEGLTLLALKLGQRARAARLCGAASAIWNAGGMPRYWYQKLYEKRMRGVRAELAEAEPEAWREGLALSIEQAIPVAATLAEALPAAEPAATTREYPDGLTTREVEVLQLIAAGKSTQEIAKALTIAEGTVERHVTNLYGKIGARNRAEATSYAHRHGLTAPRQEWPDGLSAREVEVLRLMALGKSNREIAERLVISVNTVFQHVRSILNKTDCANRTEAAAYALRRGLVE
ncbi:MAG TPA: response regulator transcription factor [Dehalococcoidia bacterium]